MKGYDQWDSGTPTRWRYQGSLLPLPSPFPLALFRKAQHFQWENERGATDNSLMSWNLLPPVQTITVNCKPTYCHLCDFSQSILSFTLFLHLSLFPHIGLIFSLITFLHFFCCLWIFIFLSTFTSILFLTLTFYFLSISLYLLPFFKRSFLPLLPVLFICYVSVILCSYYKTNLLSVPLLFHYKACNSISHRSDGLISPSIYWHLSLPLTLSSFFS